jgi:hypothetical protein
MAPWLVLTEPGLLLVVTPCSLLPVQPHEQLPVAPRALAPVVLHFTYLFWAKVAFAWHYLPPLQ